MHVRHLLTKHAREEQKQRPFYVTGSFDAYTIEEDTKEGLITVLISMSSHVSGRNKKWWD